MTSFLLDNLFWLLTALFASAGLVWTFIRAGKTNLSPQAAILAVRGGGVFLDIRPNAEFLNGHIARSQNIPEGEVAARLPSLAKFRKKSVVVVCQNGLRSRKTVQQLLKEGFTNVYALTGGVAAWRDANFPLLSKGN
ncbi:MAG: rhodanese-like domain-containing protein [Proteobacteria bacterium]|nr:rhodanese-like domain-containing protein [Pseudomonadota bacterium]